MVYQMDLDTAGAPVANAVQDALGLAGSVGQLPLLPPWPAAPGVPATRVP